MPDLAPKTWPHRLLRAAQRSSWRSIAALGLAAGLSACGGGGGGSEPVNATVTGLSVRALSSAADPLMYGRDALVTVTGTGLATATLSFSSGTCTLGDAPTGFTNSDTQQFRTCRLIATGARQLGVGLNGSTSAQTANFEVPQPQVTVTVSNGAGVDGSFVITLDPTRAPITVDNFLRYVNDAWYAGIVFHRHAPGFVLQAGAYPEGLSTTNIPLQKASYAPIVLEQGLSNVRYTVAMARTNVLNSATSQFFINLVDNSFLDTSSGGYAAFGTITSGTAVVDAMQTAPCTTFPLFFNFSTTECLPIPNLVITATTQTR